MKTKIAAAVLFAACMTMAPRPVEAAVSVSIAFFHQELSPYGRWVYTPAYGEIWYPTVVAAGWAPYVDGEWVYTDCGWTWVSYDPFSDPFHYGTWVWVDPYGWCWEPGYVWGPAWVTWAWTDTYVGWAPLPPTFAITAGGYSGGPVTVATNQYVFVPANQFVGTNVSTIRVAPTQNPTILAGAQRATRFSVSSGLVRTGGPPASFVQRATSRPLHAVKVSSIKVRPATISASKGARLPIVAPAKERAAAMNAKKESKAVKTAPSKIARNEHATTSRHVEKKMAPTHATKTEKHAAPAPASVKHEVKPSGQTRAKPSTAMAGPPPKKEIHHEKGSSGPPPAKSVEKRQEAAPPPPRVHEEHRAAMNRPAEQPRPARQEAPPPRAEQPHPAPPPAAAAKPPEHPAPQGQGKGPKKEKGQP
jgi:uncharacterized protein DUF6600